MTSRPNGRCPSSARTTVAAKRSSTFCCERWVRREPSAASTRRPPATHTTITRPPIAASPRRRRRATGTGSTPPPCGRRRVPARAGQGPTLRHVSLTRGSMRAYSRSTSEVDEHEHRGDDEHAALHHGVLPLGDPGEHETAHAREGEDLLDDHGAAEQVAELDADHRDDRDERVVEDMAPAHATAGQAFASAVRTKSWEAASR